MQAGSVPTGRVALVLATAFFGVLLWWQWLTLPELVPVQRTPSGEVTAWASRATHLASWAVFGGLAAGVFWAAPAVLGRLPRESLRVPYAEHWHSDEHYPRALRMVAGDLGWLGTVTLTFLGLTVWGVGLLAEQAPVPGWVLPAGLLSFMAGLVSFAVVGFSRRRWRP